MGTQQTSQYDISLMKLNFPLIQNFFAFEAVLVSSYPWPFDLVDVFDWNQFELPACLFEFSMLNDMVNNLTQKGTIISNELEMGNG